jgi:predicted negative regulator of RcsB-dependent stress response
MNETEEEQIETLKKWWAENGRAIILGVLIGGSAIFGWRWWGSYQLQEAQTASFAYQDVLVEFDNGDAEQVNEGAQLLRNDYASTPYAALASLLVAKLAVDGNDLDGAAEALRWAMQNSPEQDVRNIATMRLSRVLSAQGNYDEAINLLNRDFPTVYTALVEEVKGDILVAQGNTTLAKAAYVRAQAANQAQGNSSLLQMKLDDLAATAAES